jgi:hypothetical protein
MRTAIRLAVLAIAPLVAIAQVNKSNLTGIVRDSSAE